MTTKRLTAAWDEDFLVSLISRKLTHPIPLPLKPCSVPLDILIVALVRFSMNAARQGCARFRLVVKRQSYSKATENVQIVHLTVS
ncbi:hypothetical protein [Mesorhizobium sp.]|uniref:hypothetical protein n=1 Tax=Mesorhizobium sp. TaxID=1871066 RepID=UPI000FE72AFC|nr:hypothetical protein [Mesorhizobium sp.]RWI30275.1 MAG: hypothetical protein EOQ92_02330 [Mesorhizobium sp.]RWK48071.1 MAG: hypothetical protein EOR47_19625 [Mesorhizobium sp.]RWL13613.1 MAG: hypothetical protein EOR45_02080 [Mesorhizobium sp.]TIP99249.1 MAG: hypothetical protein E5X60_09820 [Mesorhizobium sp.]TIQ22948.1 MAG: hypothetical protein E5X51_04645 [Mesorhizobium sp.]